jgi:hypothetical protein
LSRRGVGEIYALPQLAVAQYPVNGGQKRDRYHQQNMSRNFFLADIFFYVDYDPQNFYPIF